MIRGPLNISEPIQPAQEPNLAIINLIKRIAEQNNMILEINQRMLDLLEPPLFIVSAEHKPITGEKP